MGIASMILGALGYQLKRIRPEPQALYQPLYSPWLDQEGEFGAYYRVVEPRTVVTADRCYVLYRLLLQSLSVEGDVWECGVFHGGTAALMAAVLGDRQASKKLYLFDTFEGMPETGAEDLHAKGNFSDTSVEAVAQFVGHADFCVIRKGFIPQTFAGLEAARIALAHVDVDIYRSVKDCLEFIWPRLARGGFIVCDDYGFPSCPGARAAVDEFFAGKAAFPLCLPTGQALVFKGEARQGVPS